MKIPKKQAEILLERIDYYKRNPVPRSYYADVLKSVDLADYFFSIDLEVFSRLVKENTLEEDL